MDDGIEQVLKVDPLGQAVRTDEDVAFMLTQSIDSLFPFGRWNLPSDSDDLDAVGQLFLELFSQVFCRSNETTEQNRSAAIFDELFDDWNDPLELGITFAFQLVGGASHVEQAITFTRDGRVIIFQVRDVRAGDDVRSFVAVV